MSSQTLVLISPKANVGMTRRGADLIRREDENRKSELPSRRARQDGIESLAELAVIPKCSRRAWPHKPNQPWFRK